MAEETSSEGPLSIPRLAPRMTLAAQGARALRGMILTGILPPGHRLNEGELSLVLGISRSPLREAMRDLASQGLLVIVDHKGAFVPSYTLDDLREIYEVRIALEAFAVRSLARDGASPHASQLVAMLDAAAEVIEQGEPGAYPGRFDFHRELLRLTGNGQLQAAATEIDRKVQIARQRSGFSPERARVALAEHREVTACVIAADGDGAATLVTQHLRKSFDNVRRIEQYVTGDNPTTQRPGPP